MAVHDKFPTLADYNENDPEFHDLMKAEAEALSDEDKVIYERKSLNPRSGFIAAHIKVLRHPLAVVKFGLNERIMRKELELMRLAFSLGIDCPKTICYERFWNSHNREGFKAVHVMTPMDGETLDTAWPKLSDTKKDNVAHQVARIGEIMRTFRQPEKKVCGWRDDDFATTKQDGWRVGVVYDADDFRVGCLEQRLNNEYYARTTGMRAGDGTSRWYAFPRTSLIMLAHGDLVEKNIVLQPNGRIGVLSWQYAGLMPEYWDYMQIQRSARYLDYKEKVAKHWPKSYSEVTEKIMREIGIKTYVVM